MEEVVRCAQPFPFNVESLVNGLPETSPDKPVMMGAIEITTSAGAVVFTEAPDGVAVAAILFNTAVRSRGAAVSTPENSQITAVPEVPVGFGLMVTAVAPRRLFFAYHRSAIKLAPVSNALAGPASE